MEARTFDTLPPIKYDANIATIAKLRGEFMPLEITDLDDKEQFDSVHQGRMVMVKVRTTIEKQRVAQKASALKYGKDVDAAAKILFDESGPIETHLQTEEDKVTKEQERIKAEKDRVEKEKIQGRVDALQKYGIVLPFSDVASMTDDDFENLRQKSEEAWAAERQRKIEEATRLVEAQAEIDRKAIEQAAKDKEVADKEKALTREREAFEKEKREAKEKIDRAAFEIKAKEDAKVKADQDAKDEIARKEKVAEAEKAEAKRQEALKPDKEKLIAWADSVDQAAKVSADLKNAEMEDMRMATVDLISGVVKRIKEKAGVM